MNTIIASEANYYKKDSDLRFVEVEIIQPLLTGDTWECKLVMKGYGNTHQSLFGQTSMQALTFAMQHAKLNLTMLVNDGYNHYDIEEEKLLTTRETFELLNAVYGTSTLLDEAHMKTIYFQAIYRLQKGIGSEEERSIDINYLKHSFEDPHIIDYVYQDNPILNEVEIYEKAIAYKSRK